MKNTTSENNRTSGEDELEPRDSCPSCGSPVDTFSLDPLEEGGIEPNCDYYRADMGGGEVRHDKC